MKLKTIVIIVALLAALSVVAYLKNPGSGEITVMSGRHEVTLHDKQLAARIAQAIR